MKGWKTLGFNVLSGVVTVAAWPQVVEMVDPQILLVVSAMANIVLRMLTTTPVGKTL